MIVAVCRAAVMLNKHGTTWGTTYAGRQGFVLLPAVEY